jgi:hypothetical protein
MYREKLRPRSLDMLSDEASRVGLSTVLFLLSL